MKKLTKLRQVAELIVIAIRSRNNDPQKQYELFEKLLSMGGLYVKFVQLLLLKMSGDRKNLAVEYNFLLRKTYDSTPFEPINIISLLKNELGDNYQQIQEVNTQPVAAGSFGQVYKAKLNNGETVAIKVLRPSVVENIHFDMKMLGIIAKLANVGYSGAYDVKQIFSKFKHVTLKELDYPQEAFYADSVYQRYKDHHSVVIPKTYLDLSSEHLVTQKYIEGISLVEVLAQKELGIDPEEYTENKLGSSLRYQMIAVGQTMLESMLLEGSAHGDPHPGNIKLLPNNKVALLDFGICAQAPSDKQAFFALIKQYQKIFTGNFDIQGYTWAIIDLFVKDLTGAVRSLDMYNHGKISQQFFDAIADAAGSFYKSSMQDIDQLLRSDKFAKIFNSVINENNRFGFNIEIEQPEFMRATLMYIALVNSLGIKHEVLSVVYTNVVNELSETEFASNQVRTNPDEAVAIIAAWLENVASKDIYLYQMLSSKISTRALNV
jgi:predicted unusual protein kinase regulating ubiquinone biosynthesis (AarF/ABC1/UbiB family)